MHEQIKDLAEQATDEVGLNPNVFAQLIVRKCIDIANDKMNDILDQPVFNPTDELWNRARVVELTHFTLLIKKHFGVEE